MSASSDSRRLERAHEEAHHGREVPWLQVARFHKEIVERGEENFFSLNGNEGDSERWSSLVGFEPDDLAGPWRISEKSLASQPFQVAAEGGEHASLFLGGPCYLAFERGRDKNAWYPRWRPLLYREVRLDSDADGLEIVPEQGGWSLNPLFLNRAEQLQVDLGIDPDQLAMQLVEKAAGRAEREDAALGASIIGVLSDLVPEMAEEVSRELRSNTFRVQPTPWILFAPTSRFTPLTRHLRSDYERLERRLDADANDIGGLRLLEDTQPQDEPPPVPLLPIVPLDERQAEAVRAMLQDRPLTVVSGPPGCGKSQVVVALLLNAWAKGMKVLFASNNNQAVDVVLERLTRFEEEFPVAVRAGNRAKNKVQEVLRRTLNLAAGQKGSGDEKALLAGIRSRRKALQRERTELQESLRTEVPQRVSEAVAASLSAYGRHRKCLSQIEEARSRLAESQSALGYADLEASACVELAASAREWVDLLPERKAEAEGHERRRRQLEAETEVVIAKRDASCSRAGLMHVDEDPQWLRTGPGPDLLKAWSEKARAYVEKPLESDLEEVEWLEAYDRWSDEDQALAWSRRAEELKRQISLAVQEESAPVGEIELRHQKHRRSRAKLLASGLTEELELTKEELRRWAADWAAVQTRVEMWWDRLPFSKPWRLQRSLRSAEARFREVFPLSIWERVGQLDEEGRGRLAQIVELCRTWLESRAQLRAIQEEVARVEKVFRGLRIQVQELGGSTGPADSDLDEWQVCASRVGDEAQVAIEAAGAWRRRTRFEGIEEDMRVLQQEFHVIGSGIPLKEAWRAGAGREFTDCLRSLAELPRPYRLVDFRAALYKGDLDRFLVEWSDARGAELKRHELASELEQVPTAAESVLRWWAEKPRQLRLQVEQGQDWPDPLPLSKAVDALESWASDWRELQEEREPSLSEGAARELEWSIDKLQSAVGALPGSAASGRLETLLESLDSEVGADWPLEEIQETFQEFTPDRLEARIGKIEAELESGSFEEAKSNWLQRLRDHADVVRAVDHVEKAMRRHRGALPEDSYPQFVLSLSAASNWITTAQAPQALPLLPEVFDLVVIDEASQCTLTNLLPLMYRGKRLAVIGDSNQLQAIPTVQRAEENSLAKKHGVEEFLHVIGHAENDVFSAACECLPRRRADVLMLANHYRSHPQVIGFSNTRIYQRQLILQRDPSSIEVAGLGAGFHARHVSGVATRGDHGRSWRNQPEAEKVVEMAAEIRESLGENASIGIVTPFAPQKQLVGDLLHQKRMGRGILVGTAHSFQGDERDVMIFSPVVARGMTPSAARWVENPPNLINVAVTRARDALVIVADLDYCESQAGILKQLARYCRTVELLREASDAELDLFSWMCLRGWRVDVHQTVGDLEVDFLLQSPTGSSVVVEVDGEQHQKEQHTDRARDAFLRARGYKVLRIPARAVFETPFAVLKQIEEELT